MPSCTDKIKAFGKPHVCASRYLPNIKDSSYQDNSGFVSGDGVFTLRTRSITTNFLTNIPSLVSSENSNHVGIKGIIEQ